MSLALVVDCALRRISLGLADGDRLLAAQTFDTGPKQAAILPGLVRDLMSVFGARPADLSTVAVTVGPGYYTGIRVGMAYAASLAFSCGAQTVPVTTLEAAALGCADIAMPAAVAIRARAGEYFASLFSGGRELVGAAHLDIDELASRVSSELSGGLPLVLCDDPDRCSDLERLGGRPVDCHHFVIRGLASAAATRRPASPCEISAVYLRDPD